MLVEGWSGGGHGGLSLEGPVTVFVEFFFRVLGQWL